MFSVWSCRYLIKMMGRKVMCFMCVAGLYLLVRVGIQQFQLRKANIRAFEDNYNSHLNHMLPQLHHSEPLAREIYTESLKHATLSKTTTVPVHMQNKRDNSNHHIIYLHRFPNYMTNFNKSLTISSCAINNQDTDTHTACIVTKDPQQAREAKAVVFYSHHATTEDLSQLTKRQGQIWVFFAVECPVYSQNDVFGSPLMRQKINYTMTYRRDSDVWHNYGCVVQKGLESKRCYPKNFSQDSAEDYNSMKENNSKVNILREKFRNKTKMAVWFVSHCQTQSKREEYVKQLSAVVPVDIYGDCGQLKCNDRVQCLDMACREYKFYLSFENSLCKDYYTEKLMNVLLKGGVVPVVRGGGNYKEMFPPHSVIDAADFSSPEELGKYLKELSTNEDRYIQYFSWRHHYDVLPPNMPLCQLCNKIGNDKTDSQVYENAYKWWNDGMCKAPKDLT